MPASGLWEQGLVVVASEFGREVTINGTPGSDRGSGGAAYCCAARFTLSAASLVLSAPLATACLVAVLPFS